MKIAINPSRTGSEVIYDDGENEDRYSYVFSEDNIDGLQSLLYDLSDVLLCSGRYSKYRIKISVIHGDKYDCKGCDWCE
jgi:hypothetical protein